LRHHPTWVNDQPCVPASTQFRGCDGGCLDLSVHGPMRLMAGLIREVRYIDEIMGLFTAADRNEPCPFTSQQRWSPAVLPVSSCGRTGRYRRDAGDGSRLIRGPATIRCDVRCDRSFDLDGEISSACVRLPTSRRVWSIFVILVPFLGVLIYVIVRGDVMRHRDIQSASIESAISPKDVLRHGPPTHCR
jgi:hypothetical protein